METACNIIMIKFNFFFTFTLQNSVIKRKEARYHSFLINNFVPHEFKITYIYVSIFHYTVITNGNKILYTLYLY